MLESKHEEAVLMRSPPLPHIAAVLAALALCVLAPLRAASEPLPALGADLSRTSVSGLSSGAYMAGQFQVAYSRLVIGAGIVAGGPYGCANSPTAAYTPFWPMVLALNLTRAQDRCMDSGSWFTGVPGAGELARQARALADAGRIDPLSGLANDKVYIFSGAGDETVERPVVERAVELYRELGVPEANIAFVKHDQAAHAFLVEEGGLACGVAGEPYLNDCDYDQAKAVLETIYGPLKPPQSGAADGRYLAFPQRDFTSGGGAGLAAEGVVYIPASCERQAGCAVHVVFHGCKQNRERIGDTFITGSGYARWAGANRLILLFPQTDDSTVNPNACWDWWGYTGSRFLDRDAPQMLAVRLMLGRLAERR
jgi:poly(3-hydroxybutyrate) depolymerase